ncbi:MAG: protein translocase subunit SecD [Candidatus Dadabacteria bacterium]|nr:MAG: protein translocase subunit SecD [Candidatus Dadabacteria bacterium]
MTRSLRWRLAAVVGSVLVSAVFLVPSFVHDLPGWWRTVLPTQSIRLGLDLQGGIHLVLEVDVDKAVQNAVDVLAEQLRKELRDEEIATRDWRREGLAGVSFELVSRSRAEKMLTYIGDNFPNLEKVGEEGNRYRFELIEPEIKNIRQFAVEQALETIRNRVDEFGVAEPTIQRTGENGILVQLPGVRDPDRAKRLIGRTAQLEFRMLADQSTTGPTETLTGEEVDPVTHHARTVTYRVEKQVLMTGDVIADARHRPGQYGEPPYVSLTLNSRGARIFERITADNVGRRLAIILDGKVQSAPVIRERIGGGRAVITGNFTLDEARDLAIVLRAGALPAPVHIAEERTVGPSLGRDSIRAGVRSFIIGGILVTLFMVVYYRGSGLIADLGLVCNVLVLLGILAGFQATLTLPGIAGIVLTLGMAVDANVLINERIREELRLGQTTHAALDAGYSRALPAILDSNITTFLAGLVLFQFGSGPIKGFALTLCIGIASTIYSAVFASRVMHDLVLSGRPGAKVSI